MQILVVAGTLSGRGGIETCIRALATQAALHGDAVRILALCPSTDDASWQQGLDYDEVAGGSSSIRKQKLRGLPAIVRACRQQPPDVVLVIYNSTIPLVRLALALAGLRRPVMAWLHFSTAVAQRGYLLRFAHGHLCINSQIADATRAQPGVRGDTVHLVYNGTDVANAPPIPRTVDGPVRLAHVGRLMVGRQKRTDDLLRALARQDGDWRLTLVGKGEEPSDIPALQALAASLGIGGRIEWIGWQADPWAALAQADALVLCSAFEGFAMVLIEAMARGVPCISSDCPSGPQDVVREGANGWLFPVGDLDALAGRLRAVIGDRRLLPPPPAVKASVAMFSSEAMYGRIREAIQTTIDAGRPRGRGLAPSPGRHRADTPPPEGDARSSHP